MKTPFRKSAIIAAVLAIGLLTTASSCAESSPSSSDQAVSDQLQRDFQKSQPVPIFKYSQYRENLIEILTAQAVATPTTTFFFNAGVKDPVMSCPSIGFPIPGTTQLTNPQKIEDRYEGDVAIPQIEPNGTFSGETTNTVTVCRDAQGRGYPVGWEGFTMPVGGPAEWNAEKGEVELIGAPTAEFSTGED